MKCEHRDTDRKRFGSHLCPCCGRYEAKVDLCRDCTPPPVELAKRRNLTKEVESATREGSCGFCSAPTAAKQFKGDSSLLVCNNCVKG